MRAHALQEYLQEDLKKEECFYLDAAALFGIKVTNMTEMRRREEDLPSQNLIKQLNACWKEKVKNLHLIFLSCEQVVSKKDELFRKLIEINLVGSTKGSKTPS